MYQCYHQITSVIQNLFYVTHVILKSKIPYQRLFLIVFFLRAATLPYTAVDESLILVQIPVKNIHEAELLQSLGLQIEANVVNNGIAEGFASKSDLATMALQGFSINIMENNDEDSHSESGSSLKKPWYTFDEIGKLLQDLATKNPKIAAFDTIGYSIKKRPIYQFKLSGSPDTASRQRIFINGACHGNEKIGPECCVFIIKSLIEKYGSDESIKEIVDRTDFVFHPIVNPDGFNSGTKGRRTLDNGRDPNRAYGYKMSGKDSDRSLPYQWPENKAYLQCMVEAPWYLSIDYHCGMIALLMAGGIGKDKEAFAKLKEMYPLGDERDWVDSYFLNQRGGGLSHTGAYGKCGSFALLPELCKHYPSTDKIESLTKFNYESLIKMSKEMQKGVKGRVYNAKTGEVLYARVSVKGYGSEIFTDPRSGYFHKYIASPSGTFEVTVFANGHKSETKSVQATSSAFATLDFPLKADPTLKYAALSVDVIGIGNKLSTQETRNCLELHDGKGATINNGFIIVDLGPKYFLTDREGNDLTIYSTNNDEYTVSVHSDVGQIVDGGKKIGSGKGTQSFDLKTASIKSARWVRVEATSGSPCIDAIEAEPLKGITSTQDESDFVQEFDRTIILSGYGNKNKIVLQTYVPKGNYSITLYNILGKNVALLAKGYAVQSKQYSFQWHGTNKNGGISAAGTYFVKIQSQWGTKTLKTSYLH